MAFYCMFFTVLFVFVRLFWGLYSIPVDVSGVHIWLLVGRWCITKKCWYARWTWLYTPKRVIRLVYYPVHTARLEGNTAAVGAASRWRCVFLNCDEQKYVFFQNKKLVEDGWRCCWELDWESMNVPWVCRQSSAKNCDRTAKTLTVRQNSGLCRNVWQ